MSISHPSSQKFQRAFVPTTALAQSVDFDSEMMRVTLIDGAILVFHSRGSLCCALRLPERIHYRSAGWGELTLAGTG